MVERLSVLIGVGVTPQSAWRYLAESRLPESRLAESRLAESRLAESRSASRARMPDVDVVIARVVRDIESGRQVADAIGAAGGGRRDASQTTARTGEFTAGAAWSSLAAAWFIATEAGAPLAACLDDIARSLLAAGEVERDTAAALAGPLATTRLVITLPLVSIVSSALLGLDTLRILVTTPAGLVCLLLGGALLVIARAWSARLVRRARRVEAVPGLALDLVAVAASGGGSLLRAVDLVDEALRRFHVAATNDPRAVADVLNLASRAGAPPGELLRAEAMRIRRDAVSLARRRAAALDVWLMMPLGLCVLPAFVLLAVVPVVVGVISTLTLG